MKFLVTGGCGFIGSNFLRHALAGFPEVEFVNIDALTYAGNPKNLTDVARDPRYQFIKGDIADTDFVNSVFSEHRFDMVINFAAETHVDRSIEDAQRFLRTNVIGTQVLLDASRKQGVTRYLQVGTDEVYGSLGHVGKFTESSPLCPRNPYSASKAAADHLVMAYNNTYGMDTVITRCTNNYGPYQFPEKLIPLVILNAFEYKPIPVYGDGLQSREMINVIDHCRGIEFALSYGKAGEVYNFGSGVENTNLDVVKKILRLMDRPESLITHVKDRPGHDRRYSLESTKAHNDLGWYPEISFDEGLAQTVQWYMNNAAWLQEVTSGTYQEYYETMYGNRGAHETSEKAS